MFAGFSSFKNNQDCMSNLISWKNKINKFLVNLNSTKFRFTSLHMAVCSCNTVFCTHRTYNLKIYLCLQCIYLHILITSIITLLRLKDGWKFKIIFDYTFILVWHVKFPHVMWSRLQFIATYCAKVIHIVVVINIWWQSI